MATRKDNEPEALDLNESSLSPPEEGENIFDEEEDNGRDPIFGEVPAGPPITPFRGVRERLEFFFYDTAFDSDLEAEFHPKEKYSIPETYPGTYRLDGKLFGTGKRIGYRKWTNMQMAGVLAADQTAVIKRFYIKLSFDGDIDDARERLDLVEMGTNVQLVVGDKPIINIPLISALAIPETEKEKIKTAVEMEDKDPPVGFTHADFEFLRIAEETRTWWEENTFSPCCRSYYWELNDRDIHVPARQNFGVELEFTEEARDAIETFEGKKKLKMWIGGTQSRDVP